MDNILCNLQWEGTFHGCEEVFCLLLQAWHPITTLALSSIDDSVFGCADHLGHLAATTFLCSLLPMETRNQSDDVHIRVARS
jgi:hypothetical protein